METTRWRRFAAVLLTTVAASAHAAVSEGSRVTLGGHVVPVVHEAVALKGAKADAAGAPMTITVVLQRVDGAGFQRLLADLYDPASPLFRQFVPARELADRFGPYESDVAAVASYFVGHGMRLIETSMDRTTLTFAATAEVTEKSLAISIVDYNHQGRRFFANSEEPSLPPEIAARVQAVLGLSDYALAVRNGVRDENGRYRSPTLAPFKDAIGKAACAVLQAIVPVTAEGDVTTWVGCTARPTPPNGGNGGGGSKDLRVQPKQGPIGPWAGLNGAGQKIGLIQFDSYVASDVADLVAYLELPPATANNVIRVPVNGGAPLGPNQEEVLLDIGYILPFAPAAQIRVYDSPFTGAGSFQQLFSRAIADGMSIISNSWAYCENETSAADVQSLNSIFATAAAAGISIFNASGDTGSTCLNGAANTLAVPASLPNATAVGGTTQLRGPGFTLSGETWWDGTSATPPTGRSGYGLSRFFARPAYQNALNPQPFRSVPDVVTNADPATGIHICLASKGGCPTGLIYGGTSMAAPAMAAYTARLNQASGANLGFLNPALYALAGSDAFRSPASLGVDFARAGLGSPNVNVLHVRLHNLTYGPTNPLYSTVETLLTFEDAVFLKPLGGVAADGATPLYIVVTARDGQGNTLAGKTVTLNASSPASTVAPASAVTSLNNGTAVFTVTSLTPHNVTFTANVVSDGISLPATDPVSFVVPPAAAASINAFPTTVLNDGIATTTITVTLQDALGRPTPGKTVAIDQGSGRSIISGPTPSITDANGQIQFTATNRIAETVTYKATDVTDRNLPVPGSATVTFSGTASSSCAAPPPGAGAGYAITSFATGFLAEAFNFSNVNWGCAGASNPAFDGTGAVLIANFRTGALYRLPPAGGAANSGNIISNPGQTIGSPVFGKDGRLYATRGATGGNFTTGNILELDPQTGATVRVVASNLTCPGGLAVDPISGDLFFTGTCFGAGSDDARLRRVSNLGSATPTVSTYATLPATPNGAVSFAPDGTIFVATEYTQSTKRVVRVTGTNQPQPATVANIPGGLETNFWVTVGEVLPNGAAKSLIVLGADNKLKLADITTNPPTLAELTTTAISSGNIGPDGCLYASNGETVFRLSRADGTCGFAPTSPAPAISISPSSFTPNPAQGTTVTLTASVVGVPATAGTPVLFLVLGANLQVKLVRTDNAGKATFTYIGNATGTDVVTASATVGATELASNEARIDWSPGTHSTFVTLNQSPEGAVTGTPVTLTAALVDTSTSPNTAVSGVTLQFNVAGQSCNSVTNASGIASCQVTIPLTGNYTLTVSFAGNAGFLASTDAVGFTVLPPGPPPCDTFNDVDSTSIFCANVLWIQNRLVTFGCLASFYCPNDAVTRLQMAAFMNRLGNALTGVLRSNAAQPGPLDLDAEPVVCQTTDLATDTFIRRAYVDASFSGMSTAGTGFAADVVATFDNGATWVPLAAVGNRAFAAPGQWAHVRASGVADLTEGQTVRFGIWVSRGGLAGGADLTDSRCKLRAAIGNR